MGKSLEQVVAILRRGKSIIQPLPTPLEPTGEGLDVGVATKIIERAFSYGFHVFARSTTGAAPFAAEGTSRSLIVLASDLGRNTDQLVFAGVPPRGTEETIRYINGFLQQTREVDVAVLPSPPHFFISPDEVLHHVKEVHDRTEMPIALYGFDDLFGTSYSLGMLSNALGLERVIGIKSSNPNDYTSEALKIAHMRNKFLWVGSESDALHFYEMGCDGFVPSAANAVPLLFQRLQSLRQGDKKEHDFLKWSIISATQLLYPNKKYRQGIIYAMHVLFGAQKKLPKPLEYGLDGTQEKLIAQYLGSALDDRILEESFRPKVEAVTDTLPVLVLK